MSFQKFKSDSCCVRGRQVSATKIIYSNLTSNDGKVLIGYCSICIREKSMTVSDNTIVAEGQGGFLKTL